MNKLLIDSFWLVVVVADADADADADAVVMTMTPPIVVDDDTSYAWQFDHQLQIWSCRQSSNRPFEN